MKKILPEKLPKDIFKAKENPKLLAEAVRVFLANQRKANPKAKTRGEVSGSGRKIYRQKGTGRARHGDQYSNIFVGGGVAHGPKGDQNRKLTLNKKKNKQALKVALSQKLKENKLIFVDNLELVNPKTKEALKTLKEILEPQQKTLLIYGGKESKLILPFRNIPWVEAVRASDLNVYTILSNKFLIIDQEALKEIKKRLQ